jgi:hypothetical protein
MDTTEDIICSRFDISDYSAQNQSNGNYHPARTPLGNNRTNNNSKNVTRSYCDKGLPINIDQQETSMNVNANSTSVSIRLKQFYIKIQNIFFVLERLLFRKLQLTVFHKYLIGLVSSQRIAFHEILIKKMFSIIVLQLHVRLVMIKSIMLLKWYTMIHFVLNLSHQKQRICYTDFQSFDV